ncbi:MAG: hypothetical protein SFT91_00185 [Rickettsiaceae bacterium]|nr:hypothetical protein [Rickettsiaceae bacterium]
MALIQRKRASKGRGVTHSSKSARKRNALDLKTDISKSPPNVVDVVKSAEVPKVIAPADSEVKNSNKNTTITRQPNQKLTIGDIKFNLPVDEVATDPKRQSVSIDIQEYMKGYLGTESDNPEKSVKNIEPKVTINLSDAKQLAASATLAFENFQAIDFVVAKFKEKPQEAKRLAKIDSSSYFIIKDFNRLEVLVAKQMVDENGNFIANKHLDDEEKVKISDQYNSLKEGFRPNQKIIDTTRGVSSSAINAVNSLRGRGFGITPPSSSRRLKGTFYASPKTHGGGRGSNSGKTKY